MNSLKLRKSNIAINFHRVKDIVIFKKILNYYKKKYEFLSLSELKDYFSSNSEIRNKAILTFDDGDKSIFDISKNILKRLDLPFCIFISPIILQKNTNYWFQDVGYIINKTSEKKINILFEDFFKEKNGNIFSNLKSKKINEILNFVEFLKIKTKINIPFQNLTLNQLIDLKESCKVELGSHTLNHPILKNETDEISYNEIKYSINMLSNITREKIKYFAYPNGLHNIDFSNREIEFLKINKIKMAFTTENDFFSIQSDPYMIPRIGYNIDKYDNNCKIFLKNSYPKMFGKINRYIEIKNRNKTRPI